MQRKRLSSLINLYEGVFQLGGEPTPFAEHHIDTGNARPIAVPPYRLTPAKKELLTEELSKLLDSDVIEECESPWAAPVVLVPKPDGKIRLCVDYRRLNGVTVNDSYPLPRIDDLLHATKKTAFASTLDLQSGYHQVQVFHGDRDKTAFTTPFGTFRFKRMPFGLKTAPATFQRLMDRFRSGLGDVLVLIYLDDLIVLSETFQDHLDDLKKIFIRLRQFKLQANRDKCNFVCTEVKYLGHLITSEGIKMNPEKISAILNMSAPKNVRQCLSFLQTCSWYRRFIADFAAISKPLSDLSKKNATWKWTTHEQSAYDKLKELLTTAPVLQQNREGLPYILRMDASKYALGAVLLQSENEDEHPIEYASRLLSGAEMNYSTTEREALAVVWALNRF